MGTPRVLFTKYGRYYRYNSYGTWNEALNVAKYYQRKYKSRYMILPYETGFTNSKRYMLYMNKVIVF